MRRFFSFALIGLVCVAATSRAGCPLGGCCPTCQPIPCTCCEKPNDCPCDHRLNLNVCHDEQKWIDLLHAGCGGGGGQCGCENGGPTCCERIKAAEKLGCRLHADFCCCPEVLDALLGALSCDRCWEVRHAAAWSLMKQDARTDQVVMALYISSKTDPHYMVRTRAAEALDILTLCRKCYYKDLYTRTDELIKELKKQGYKPGSDNCQLLLGAACAACGVPVVPTAAGIVQGPLTVGPGAAVIETMPKEKVETMPREKLEGAPGSVPADLPPESRPAGAK